MKQFFRLSTVLLTKNTARAFKSSIKPLNKPRQLTANTPVIKEPKASEIIVDIVEEKWLYQRDELIQYPERLKEHELQKTLQKFTKLPGEEFKALIQSDAYQSSFLEKISNNVSIYEDQTLVEVTNLLSKALQSDSNKELQLFDKIEAELCKKNRAENLTLEQVADILWNYAYANRGSRAFFRQLETAIMEHDNRDVFDYRLLSKILWGLSHNDKGSTAVYSKIAKMIHPIYIEISPLKLAEYSFYFSKATEAMQGGFGVYQLAEKSITEHLKYFNFDELVRTAAYLFPQNIGSNVFHELLESRILVLYPGEISPSTLVSLCKSTAFHNFQNEKLAAKLTKDVYKYLEHLSNSQVELILWSYVRGRRVTEEFIARIEAELLKRLKTMTVRGIVFTFYDLCMIGRSNPVLVKEYQEYFEKNIEKLSTHYLTKVLTALAYKPYDEFTSKMFSALTDRVNQLAEKFRKGDPVKILDAVYNYPTVKLPPNAEETFNKLRNLVLKNIEKFTVTEASKLLFCYAESNKLDAELEEKLLNRLKNVSLIPKSHFAEAFYAVVLIGRHELAEAFLPILDELGTYGNIKYFFEHSSFIRILWAVSALILRGGPEKLIFYNLDPVTIKEAILEINPNTLKPKVLRLYLQLLQVVGVFGEISQEEQVQIAAVRQQINLQLLDEVFETEAVMQNDKDMKQKMAELVSQKVLDNPENYKIYINAKDEFLNIVDIAVTNESNQRLAYLILNQRSYVRDKTLDEYTQMKLIILEQVMKWRVFTIDAIDWQNKDAQEQIAFLRSSANDAFAVKTQVSHS